MDKKYEIFGVKTQIRCSDKKISDILEKELAVYPLTKGPTENHINIEKLSKKSDYNFKNSLTIETNYGLFKSIKAYFSTNSPFKTYVFYKNYPKFINLLEKSVNIQFTSLQERFGQILHEFILIPFIHFCPDKLLVHASAFNHPKKGIVLIGGKGGVGKTSLQLYFCQDKNNKFITDDIAIINKTGEIFPNLSYPKIYGYNVEKNKKIQRKILHKRKILDKLQYYSLFYLRGKNKVRRRLSPAFLYNDFQKTKLKISEYYILTRKNVENIKKIHIDSKTATNYSLEIIKKDYEQFYKQISNKNLLDKEKLFKRWENLENSIFEKVNCYILEIPTKISHQNFIKKASKLIES